MELITPDASAIMGSQLPKIPSLVLQSPPLIITGLIKKNGDCICSSLDKLFYTGM
jgi:hypothetical protein